MNTIISVLNHLNQGFIGQKFDTMLISDVSPYGSKSCSQELIKNAKNWLETFRNETGISSVYFEPSWFNVTKSADISSSVEREVLLRSRHLIAIGGGSYQFVLVKSFQKMHGNNEQFTVKQICKNK